MMTDKPITAVGTETVGAVLERMRGHGLHVLPVLADDGVVQGVVTRFSIMAHIVPSYIVTGDLNAVSYAPDFGLLRRHYEHLLDQAITTVMDREPLLVKADASLLSVASALITDGKHESALVVDEDKRLLGVISVGDVLASLKALPDGAAGA